MGGGRRKEWRRNVFIDLGTSRQQPHSVEMKFYQIIRMALQTMRLIIHDYTNKAIDNTHGFANNATIGKHRQTKFQLYTSKHQSLLLFDTFKLTGN